MTKANPGVEKLITELTVRIRREMHKKQSEHAHNTYWALHSVTYKEQRAHAAAMRRNEKSIALLTSKLLCQHTPRLIHGVSPSGVQHLEVRCDLCKAIARA